MTRFDVTATCGDAYEGVAQVSMCKEPGEPHLDHIIIYTYSVISNYFNSILCTSLKLGVLFWV